MTNILIYYNFICNVSSESFGSATKTHPSGRVFFVANNKGDRAPPEGTERSKKRKKLKSEQKNIFKNQLTI